MGAMTTGISIASGALLAILGIFVSYIFMIYSLGIFVLEVLSHG